MHEAQLHDELMFLTLTYDDKFLPFGGNLHPPHMTNFIKRVRKAGHQIRYYYCGEYGDKNDRPHYHAIIFGWWPTDAYHWRTQEKYKYYRSEQLEKLWKFGNSEFTTVTKKTCSYVARYVTKKITGDDAEDHYERVDLETGEIFSLLPEFARMSLRPAIAREWWEKYGQAVTDWDSVVIDGNELPPPKYYDTLLGLNDEQLLEDIKRKRVRKAKASPDNKPARLATREESAKLKLKRLKREL